MANVRFVTSNSTDTAATLTASTTSGTLVAANLQTDIKSDVWRATTTSGTITATWSAAQTINMVALPFTNFTNAATMRVKGYTNVADVSPAFDTTALSCCAYTSGSIPSPGVANFGYSGAVYAVLWFTGAAVKKIEVILSDAGNSSGYIEVGRMVCGDWFSPTFNADYGLKVGWDDRSNHEYDGSGGLRTKLRTRSKMISFNLSNLNYSDRATFFKMLRNGLTSSFYFSGYPTDSNAAMVQDYQIYGRLSQLSEQVMNLLNNFTQSITIKEV